MEKSIGMGDKVLENALHYLMSRGAQAAEAKVVYEDTTHRHLVVPSETGPRLMAMLRDAPDVNIVVHSLVSFVQAYEYLQKAVKEGDSDAPAVWVDSTAIYARFSLFTTGPVRSVRYPLQHTEAYGALMRAAKPQLAPALVELLQCDLGCYLDRELALQLMRVTVRKSSSMEIEVDRTGLINEAGHRSVQLTTGPDHAEVGVDWLYTGPVFRGFDRGISQPLMLRIQSGDSDSRGTKFSLKAVGAAEVLDAYAGELIVELRQLMPAGTPIILGSPVVNNT